MTTTTLYTSPSWTDLTDEQREAVLQVLQDAALNSLGLKLAYLAARSKLNNPSSTNDPWETSEITLRETVYETLMDHADRWEEQEIRAKSRGLQTRVTRASGFRVAFTTAAKTLGYATTPYRYT